jgi:hypothetical protein
MNKEERLRALEDRVLTRIFEHRDDSVTGGKGKKVKLSLCLTKHHAMKTYWGMEVYLHAFLTSALDGGEWSASRPSRFTPRERAPWIGG